MTPRNVNRIDHVAALVRPERMTATVARLSLILQTAFYGPYDRPDIGVRIATSWDAGITLVSPISGGDGHIADALESHGAGWWTVAYGVRDLGATLDRMHGLGYERPALVDGLTGVEPWFDRFLRLDEARYDPALYGGLPVTLCTIEERPTPAARAGSGRITQASALVSPEDLDSTVARLSFALQTAFYGPFERADIGARIATSWDSGVELIAPLSDGDGPIAAEFERRGPGWWSVAYDAGDLGPTRARLARLGHQPVAVIGRTGVEPWSDRFRRLDEVRYSPELTAGLPVTFQDADEHRADPG